MNRLVLFMARRRTTWYPWMVLGIPVWFLESLFDLLQAAAFGLYHEWRYFLRNNTIYFFGGFSEARRNTVRSLGLRPEPGGKLMRR